MQGRRRETTSAPRGAPSRRLRWDCFEPRMLQMAAYRSPLRERGAWRPLNQFNLIAIRRIDEDEATA